MSPGIRDDTPNRSFLEAEQVSALLDAAGDLDARGRRGEEHLGRRAILATLALAGLRVGELTELRWRDVDLAAGRVHVRDSKTAAGIRAVEIGGILRDTLTAHKARSPFTKPHDRVFPTSSGAAHSRSNIRNRILKRALPGANKRLQAAGHAPIDPQVTLHALRRTYISLLLEGGTNPRVVMEQAGHSSPALTLRVYAQVMNRREATTGERIDALIGQIDWAEMGRNGENDDPSASPDDEPPIENPPDTSNSLPWAVQDSNLRPPACKAGALAS